MKNYDKSLWGMGICLCASTVCAVFSLWGALCTLISGTVISLLYLWQTRKRVQALRNLNEYLSLLCAGHYDFDISDNAEGELSILKNNLLKVIVRLRTQNELLEKDRQMLADALEDISHQLKTPMTSMMVICDLLREKKPKDEQRRREFIGILDSQLERMHWLITNLLKLSKLEAGTVEFKTETVALSKVIERSMQPFLLSSELKGVDLSAECGEETVRVDILWCAEAIGNIIKNCLEHTEKGGAIRVVGAQTGLYTSVRITDTGCGIAAEDLPHVFERFYHGKDASSESVGIGLSLSKAIINRFKGDFTVQSRPGQGTSFEIRFYKSIV